MSQDITALDRELNDMILAGNALDAFEKFYDDSCTMQENIDPPRVGKPACRDYEVAFFSNVAEVQAVELLASTAAGDRSYSEWRFAMTFKDGTKVDNTQVAARTWKDSKVVAERFYYNPNVTPPK